MGSNFQFTNDRFNHVGSSSNYCAFCFYFDFLSLYSLAVKKAKETNEFQKPERKIAGFLSSSLPLCFKWATRKNYLWIIHIKFITINHAIVFVFIIFNKFTRICWSGRRGWFLSWQQKQEQENRDPEKNMNTVDVCWFDRFLIS